MNLLSRIARRFVTPHVAASIVSKHGAEARRMTARQRYDDFHNRLRAEVQASKARSGA